MGRFFDEFSLAEEFTTPGRTLTEADLTAFAGISGDFNEAHTNKVYCESQGLDGLVPQTNLVIAVASGLISRLGLFEGTGLGLAELTWSVHSPVHVGDTLRCRLKIIALEASDDATGIAVREVEVVNQHGQVVHSGTHHVLMRRSGRGG